MAWAWPLTRGGLGRGSQLIGPCWGAGPKISPAEGSAAYGPKPAIPCGRPSRSAKSWWDRSIRSRQNCSSWSASSASCAEKDAGDSSRARNRTSLCSGQSLASSTRTVVSPRSMVSLAEIATALPRQAHAHRRDGQCQRPQHRGRGRSCDRVLLRPVGLSSGNAPSSQLSLCWIAAGACGPRHPANAVGRLCSCRQRQGHRSGRSPPVPGAFRPLRRVNEPQRLTL
jgi:hypothetical protein